MNRDFAAMNADPAAREDFVRRCLTCIDEACEAAAEDLVRLRRRIKVYYDMASQCKVISTMLSEYYNGEDIC